jgi:uncharacterized membrane protein
MKNATLEQMRTGLRIHAIAFVSSMVLMLVINLLTGEPNWIVWVLLGWGVGLLSHWLAVRSHLVRNLSTGRSD